MIRHARAGGRPGRWNYSMKRQLDSGLRRNEGSFPQLRHILRGWKGGVVRREEFSLTPGVCGFYRSPWIWSRG